MKLGNLIILRAGIRQFLPFNSMSFRMCETQTLFIINLKRDFQSELRRIFLYCKLRILLFLTLLKSIMFVGNIFQHNKYLTIDPSDRSV